MISNGFMKYCLFLAWCFSLLIFGETAAAQANKKRKTPTKSAAQKTIVEPEKPAVIVREQQQPANNGTAGNSTAQTGKKNHRENQNQPAKNADPSKAAKLPYGYEFSQPEFYVNHVVIEHDASGKGTITFERRGLGEPITDPIQINPAALDRIKNLWTELNFLDSTEVYQSVKYDYKHLGQMKLRMQEAGKKREAELNWTENKTAENLTKEYKRLTEHYVWLFDLSLARENQPLEAPKLMDKLDGLIKRGEIYDGDALLPALREAKDDERIPLIARNHAERLIKQIEKMAEKKR